jgi:hypothetical protein
MLKKIILSCFLFTGVFSKSNTQPDTIFRVESMRKNTDFASLTIGTDMLLLSRSNAGQIKSSARFQPRITVGGIHFWGHADFYVTFPLGNALGKKAENTTKMVYYESVETGCKYYPLALKPNKLRPYIGMSFQPVIYRIDLSGTGYKYGGSRYTGFISPVQAGLTYAGKKFLYTAGVRYNWRNQFDYHLSPESVIPVSLDAWNVNMGFIRYIDTDKNYSGEHSIDQLNKKHYILTKEKAFNSWYIGLGPSSALQMSKSPYFREKLPYMYNQMIFSGFVPEVAAGKYFHKNRMNVNVAARFMSHSIKAFNTEVGVSRSSIALETHHFLFNYRGFVPFFGPSLNVEHLTFNQDGQLKLQNTKLALGIVLGWDINLSDVETSLLRTNLRYMPGLHLLVEGEKMMYDYLEFNFIQYVYFFNRAKTFKKYRKK